MTDKEIIIDGVDVSKCPDLLKEYLPSCYCSTLDKENQEASCAGCFCLFKIKQYMNNNKLIEDLKYELASKTAECEKLKENIKTIFTSLIIANHVDIGAIQDTIWVDNYTTLWDYIRIVLNMDDKQFEEFEKQALRQIGKQMDNIETSECPVPEGDCFHCLNPNCPLINKQRSQLTLNDLQDEKEKDNGR